MGPLRLLYIAEMGPITVEEAVVFEAAPAEERVEGVQRLLPLHGLGEGSVQVGGAQQRQLHQAVRLKEVFVSAKKKKKKKKKEHQNSSGWRK